MGRNGPLILVLWIFLAIFVTITEGAAPFVSNALGSNMVLQRDRNAVLWGWTNSSSVIVSVTFQGKLFNATSDKTGRWTIELPAQPATPNPQTISISSTTGQTAVLENVLFGDVYLCSGQSNMQMSVAGAFNASQEIKKAQNYPNIRLFTVGQGTTSRTPLDFLSTIEQNWSVASSDSVGNGPWSFFSAACWFTATSLYDQIEVPLGMISSNWGGTPVQAWLSQKSYPNCTGGDPSPGCDYSKPEGNPNCPSNLFNAMIVPFLPMRLSGVLWYQGESNSAEPAYYACGFPLMIQDWRNLFATLDLPFFFVQLAPWNCGATSLPIGQTRLAQISAMKLNNVGFATAIDLGDIGSPLGDIHPRDKQSVGRRLTSAILKIVYGKIVHWEAPSMYNITYVYEDKDVRVKILFKSNVGNLTVVTPQCPAPVAACSGFEVMFRNGVWVVPTSILATGANEITIVVQSNTPIIYVRYAINCWPLLSIYDSGTGLPALPFDLSAYSPSRYIGNAKGKSKNPDRKKPAFVLN